LTFAACREAARSEVSRCCAAGEGGRARGRNARVARRRDPRGRFRQAPLLEPVSLLRACSIDLLILQVPKIAGAGEVHGVEPLVLRRAAALVPTVSCDSEGSAMLASPIRGRVVLAGIQDGDGDASGGRGANPSAGSTKLRQNLQGGEIRTAAVGSHLGRV
jgi:hypothetical protein